MSLLRVAIAAVVVAAAAVLGPAACTDETTANPLDAQADAPLDAHADASDGSDAATPKGSRILGAGIDLGDQRFVQNIQDAQEAGAQSMNVQIAWDDLEQPYDAGPDADLDGGPSTYIFGAQFHVVNLLLPDMKMSAALAVDAIDVGGPRLPADLVGRTLDDPEVMARYDRIVDYVVMSAPDLDVAAFLVGESVDRGLGTDEPSYAALTTFVTHVAAHAKTASAKLTVGFTVTSDGLAAQKDLLAAPLAASDFVGVRYIAVDAAAQIRPVGQIVTDFDALVAAAPSGKPILVIEAGFPSATECGSSDATEAAFVSATFDAWDRHADRIALLTFVALDDPPPDVTGPIATREGRSGDATFLAMLGSLGLRRNHVGKPAFASFGSEARARGW